MPAGPVIANNTPLVAFWILGRLDLLRDLFQEVLIPQAVFDEFVATQRAVRETALSAVPWIKVSSVENSRHVLAYTGLDQGEAEVLALAEERTAHLIIMDEKKGRRFAKRMTLPVTGTSGVLLLAKEKGLIKTVRPFLEELQTAGLYFSPSPIAEVLSLAGEAT
jgi:uncharacterized protein